MAVAVVFATLIIKEKIDFILVPDSIQGRVKDILIAMGLPELAE